MRGIASLLPRTAAPDIVRVAPGAKIEIPTLANDGDPDNDPIHIKHLGSPSAGNAVVVGAQQDQVQYTAAAASATHGQQIQFDYTISDGAADATSSITITIDDGDPTYFFGLSSFQFIEGATEQIRINRSGGATRTTSCNFDFSAFNSRLNCSGNGVVFDVETGTGSCTFQPGQTFMLIDCTLVADQFVLEDFETTCRITPNENYIITGPSEVSMTIREKNTKYTVTANVDCVEEGKSVTFTITRMGNTRVASAINWSLNNTRLDGQDVPLPDPETFGASDYPTGSVNFAVGETTKTVTLNITNDSQLQTTRFFGFKVDTASPDGLAGDQLDIEIKDDDSSFNFNTANLLFDEGSLSGIKIERKGNLSGVQFCNFRFDAGTIVPGGVTISGPGIQFDSVLNIGTAEFGDGVSFLDVNFTSIADSGETPDQIGVISIEQGDYLVGDPIKAAIVIVGDGVNVASFAQDHIALIKPDRNGNVRDSFKGTPAEVFEVQVTSDFKRWTTIAVVTADANGFINFRDLGVGGDSTRLYRTVKVTPPQE